MKNALLLIALIFSVNALADEPRHQVTFGETYGLGWNGVGITTKTDSDLDIDKYDISKGNFSVNYMYRVSSKFQIGGVISNSNSKTEIKKDDGTKFEDESRTSSFYLVGRFNFSDELNRAFYLSLFVGTEKHESDDGTDDTKSDISTVGIEFGKRFSLEFMGIQNLTFSPSLLVMNGTYGGDLEDLGVESSTIADINILKFDLLF